MLCSIVVVIRVAGRSGEEGEAFWGQLEVESAEPGRPGRGWIPFLLFPATDAVACILEAAMSARAVVIAEGILTPPIVDDSSDPPAAYAGMIVRRASLSK